MLVLGSAAHDIKCVAKEYTRTAKKRYSITQLQTRSNSI